VLCSSLLSSPRLTLLCHYRLGHRSFSCLESSPGRPACSCPIVARKTAELHETTSNSGIEIEKAEEPPLRATAALLAWVVWTGRLVGDKITVHSVFLLSGPLLDLQRHRIALHYIATPLVLFLFFLLPSLSLLLLHFLLSPITSSFSNLFRPPHSISAHDETRTRRQSLSIISKLHLYPVSTSVPYPQEAETINTVCHPIPSHPNFGALSYDMPSL
jgi:hypothetical protein